MQKVRSFFSSEINFWIQKKGVIVKIELSKISINKFKNDFHLSINSLIITQLQTSCQKISNLCFVTKKQITIILIPTKTFSQI